MYILYNIHKSFIIFTTKLNAFLTSRDYLNFLIKIWCIGYTYPATHFGIPL